MYFPIPGVLFLLPLPPSSPFSSLIPKRFFDRGIVVVVAASRKRSMKRERERSAGSPKRNFRSRDQSLAIVLIKRQQTSFLGNKTKASRKRGAIYCPRSFNGVWTPNGSLGHNVHHHERCASRFRVTKLQSFIIVMLRGETQDAERRERNRDSRDAARQHSRDIR